MASLHASQKLFHLETLDLRFTTSSKAPLPDPVKPGTQAKPDTVAANASPPLWRTPEFYFYYLVFIVCVPLMFHAVYEVSQRQFPCQVLEFALTRS
jgi:protein-cysteine N-palmitoyltransferase HHAT